MTATAAATEHAVLVEAGRAAYTIQMVRLAMMLTSPTDAANRMLIRRAATEGWLPLLRR